MEPDQVNTFSCAAFPSLPAQLDQEFCARRHRKAGAGDPCKGCDIGIQAAKTTAKDTRDGLSTDKRLRGDAAKRGIEIKKSEGHTEEAMAGKKLCSCGCGKLAVKDGLSTKCYRKKNGVLPFPKKGAPVKRQAGRQGNKPSPGKKSRSTGGHDHECEGCKVLQLQLDELNRAEKIMVAAGLVAPEKFEQARKIVRELGK